MQLASLRAGIKMNIISGFLYGSRNLEGGFFPTNLPKRVSQEGFIVCFPVGLLGAVMITVVVG